MSFVERLEVPEAKSRFSINATDKPRVAPSRAIPAPVMPPPITRISNSEFANLFNPSRRDCQENSVITVFHCPLLSLIFRLALVDHDYYFCTGTQRSSRAYQSRMSQQFINVFSP